MEYNSSSSFYTQYFIILCLTLFLVNHNDLLLPFVSICGKLFLTLFISSIATNFMRKFMKKEFLSSKGKAVLITGCDSGFGNRLAFKLNEYGFRVYATVLSDLNPGSQELNKIDRIKVIKMDITNDKEVHEVCDEIDKDLKLNGIELWAVVNNAGMSRFRHTEWGSSNTRKKVFDVNVFGIVRVARIFLPLIRGSKGRIINVGSVAGRTTFENFGFYSMSKHTVISFSDALRREMNKWGVKVSTIESAQFNTVSFAAKTVISSMDKEWNETPDKLKKDYGQKYFDRQKSVFMNFEENFQTK